MEQALALAIKVIAKTTEGSAIKAEMLEVARVTREGENTVVQFVEDKVLEEAIKLHVATAVTASST